MNVRVNLQKLQPGIMGKMILAIQTVADRHIRGEIDIDDINNLNFFCEGQNNEDFFNYVLDQAHIDKYDKMYEWKVFSQPTDISSHKDFLIYKRIAKKINIKKSIFEKIPKEIDENTIGVHIRLTDMNTHHSDIYGHKTLDTYLYKLDKVLDNNNDIKKIFISSDNEESISKIKSNYDIIVNDITNRNKKETDSGYFDFLLANCNDFNLWQSTFVDSISLSKCGYILKGDSSFSAIPIIFSSTIKGVYTV